MIPILLNRIQCNNCKDIITSYTVHDYKLCNCGRVGVDGGTQYLRRSFTEDREDVIELSVIDDANHETRRNNMYWGTYGKKGNQPLKYKLVKDLDEDHIIAILNNVKIISKLYSQTLEDEIIYRENIET